MKYLLVKGHNIVKGDSFLELAMQAGFKLKDRTVFIQENKYHSFSEEFSEDEMYRQAGRDAVELLRKNYGWMLYELTA